ncbi:UNVERIFIED_CONTAM: MerR-like DNA binding protein [Acetivibrio alkalicellulosi]
MEVLKDRYTITELSEYLNVTDHALRYYEKEFNMYVPKDRRGRRYYTTDLANIMYQIKNMRDEGLEIKAIKKLLQPEIEVAEPQPVNETDNTSITPYDTKNNTLEIQKFFKEFGDQITSSFSVEVTSAKDHFTSELNKTKLELGACLENNIRKMECKMDKHFQNVDKSIGIWRERNKGGLLRRLTSKVFKNS